MLQTIVSGPLLVTIACSVGLSGCGLLPFSITRDYSDFDEFSLDREEYLDLCVDLDSVYSATIRRQPDDGFTVQLNIVTEIRYEVPDCPVDTTPGSNDPGYTCPTLNALAERPISGAEVERMNDLFSRVHFEYDGIFGLSSGPFDPCSFTILAWDGRPGRPDLIDYEYLADVQEFLESLRPE